ncbi:uncharacterized protein TrAFT101_007194 [Trichoderma asperellum]|uniref:uncharacterized protein n=1 Tax=Trichoderma asperellum TaxID=101201 RepID=UPI0033248219|nr:hypothetical protein TrAFT101_007194 [Trichoderma asperellum]
MCSASDDGLPETKAGDCAGRTPGSATPSLLALRHIPSDDQSSGGQQAAAKDACMSLWEILRRHREASSKPPPTVLEYTRCQGALAACADGV